MADKERRTGKASRRAGSAFEKTGKRSSSGWLAPDRRRTDRRLGRLLLTGEPPEAMAETGGITMDYAQDRRTEEMPTPRGPERRKGTFDRRVSSERRYGAGRRSNDLSRALDTGESVIFDLGKKSKGILKKVARKAGPLGLALTVGTVAKEAKASTKGMSMPKTTGYKGEKSILPPKPKVR